MFFRRKTAGPGPEKPNLLVVQSGNTDLLSKAVRVIAEKLYPGCRMTYLCDNRHQCLPEDGIPNLEKRIVTKPGLVRALFYLLRLRRLRYDVVAVFFSGEGGYFKHKIMAVLCRKKKLLIFNENVDCFFYTREKMEFHLKWRFRNFRNRSRKLRLARETMELIKREGTASFLKKSAGRLVQASAPVSAYQQKKRVEPFSLPRFEDPEVSIVIPVYNKSLFTYNCILSVRENTRETRYEVVVVDNASTDNTASMLAMIEHVRVIRNRENLGFVEACNIGARASRGKYVLFLNNDTLVTPGWLSAMLETFRRKEECGAVGSKLIYPNGRLQEAGGIIWKDASGWNYGKFDDPDKPEYNYLREVDYCSGASLMVRKELFEGVGGFDARYAPAYCEDTDLCFSLRSRRYKVFYQPRSVIVHFEGVSAGTSTASGMKRYQELNTPKFASKWRVELGKQLENRPENVFPARDRNRNKRVLVIDHYVPMYDRDAGSFFMYSLLRVLAAAGYRVVFWPDNLFKHEPYTTELQQMGIEVIYGPNNFKSYMEGHGKYFDCALITRTHIAINYVDVVRKHVPRVIYHSPDFEYLREKRRAGLEGLPERELENIKEREFYLFGQSDCITTVSGEDVDGIKRYFPGRKVLKVHHPVNRITDMKNPFEGRSDLLFVGSSHQPNVDAVLYYASGIMPLLEKAVPGIKLYVVGSHTDKRLSELDPERVVLTGYVPDLLPYFERCRIFLAPLRYGAGVKGKIIDAMSYGLPVVTTPVGAEGLGATNGLHLLVAENSAGIANEICRLYTDKSLWEGLSGRSRDFIAANYSQHAFAEKVSSVFSEILKEG